MVSAAIDGWAYPFSREAALLADLFDLEFAKAGVKKRKPYPRPWPEGPNAQKLKPAPGVSQAAVFKALAAAGH